jgi:hypothetical protein
MSPPNPALYFSMITGGGSDGLRVKVLRVFFLEV